MMLHQDLQRAIAELAALMRPTLTIVDASRVLMENGPAGGKTNDVKPVRTITAGVDPVALDAWALHLFPKQPAPANLGFAATGRSLRLGRWVLRWSPLAPRGRRSRSRIPETRPDTSLRRSSSGFLGQSCCSEPPLAGCHALWGV
jgi:hypothetical protein